MSLWWLAPLLLGGATSAILRATLRLVRSERAATQRATRDLRDLRPAVAAAARSDPLGLRTLERSDRR
jgi:hypothetical protein